MKIRYLRHRVFNRVRHGTRTMNWLEAEGTRLELTAETLFNTMIAQSLSFEQVEALPTPEPEVP